MTEIGRGKRCSKDAAVRLNQCFIHSLDTPKAGYVEEG